MILPAVEAGVVLMQNAHVESMKSACQLLQTYLNNVLQNPGEEKFRKIRKGNAVFQQRVAPIPGAVAVLEACHFKLNGEFYEINQNALSGHREDLAKAVALLGEAVRAREEKEELAAKAAMAQRMAEQRRKEEEKRVLMQQIKADTSARKEDNWKPKVSASAMKAGTAITHFGEKFGNAE
eukprot:tig00021319_g20205.t1